MPEAQHSGWSQTYGFVWKCCVPLSTQWFCWSLSLLNGYNWEYTLFSDKPISWPFSKHLKVENFFLNKKGVHILIKKMDWSGPLGSPIVRSLKQAFHPRTTLHDPWKSKLGLGVGQHQGPTTLDYIHIPICKPIIYQNWM